MRALFALIAAITLAASPPVAAGAQSLQVTSPAFASGQAIPPRYSAYGDSKPPPLNWTPIHGAKAYAIALWDPDAPMTHPFVHWIAWNIPGSAHALPEGGLSGMVQGRNGLGRSSYFGPRPPSGVHHYHFQVFALDAPLSLAADADFAALTAAMQGHVVAQGELVGTFAH
jgi:Raf kinase inhibitor-like YbhB/YbcL family protein